MRNNVNKDAYETKDDGGLLNAWGANPGYTSSIFSRNQYRSNVDAYKATLVWMPMKGLKLVASHADYGQSDMTGGIFITIRQSSFAIRHSLFTKDTLL